MSNGEVRVWINGTFDVLHRGHFELIRYASQIGRLRIGLDSDDRVRKMKGLSKPFFQLSDRIFCIENISGVDSVVSFNDEESLISEIKAWNPEYLIIGGDYKNKRIIGSDLCKVIYFERLGDFSTTKILGF